MSLGSVLTAIVTPFDDDLAVNEGAFVDLLHHLAAHGSDGFVVCGTTGEAPTLRSEEHLRVLEVACRNRPGGAVIVAGTGSNNTRHSAQMTERALVGLQLLHQHFIATPNLTQKEWVVILCRGDNSGRAQLP